MLFESIVFGPIKSRRLGTSLGVNVLPTEKKYCSFNCIYCECGWNEIDTTINVPLHKREDIKSVGTFSAGTADCEASTISTFSLLKKGSGEGMPMQANILPSHKPTSTTRTDTEEITHLSHVGIPFLA